MVHSGEHGHGLGALLATACGHLHRLVDTEHGLGMGKGFKFPSEFVELDKRHEGTAFLKGGMQAYVPVRSRFQWQRSG